MMNHVPWPSASDFIPMLQNPSIGFANEELKTCVIERDLNNQPRARAGIFGVCFKATFRATGKSESIKIFSRNSNERRERYSEISSYLQANPMDSLVKFEYIERGIRHPDSVKFKNRVWFPILRMEWVEGTSLFDWLRESCEERNVRAISAVAERWLELSSALDGAGIAHGDLQHGNVIVLPTGRLKLIDYDCMCVPSLVGRPNLEIGAAPYQHPDRNEETLLYPGLDRFSQLFIFVCLNALAADPTLWFRYVEPPDGDLCDTLLLQTSDLALPEKSALVRELKQSANPVVKRLLKALLRYRDMPLTGIPSLSAIVSDIEKLQADEAKTRGFSEPAGITKSCSPDVHETKQPHTEGANVFISFKSEDVRHAEIVFEFLTSKGISCFFSERSLPLLSNSDYRVEIDRALDRAKHIVVVTSSTANVTSGWVEAEWGGFINEKRNRTKSGNVVTLVTGDLRRQDLPLSLRHQTVLTLSQKSLETLLQYVSG